MEPFSIVTFAIGAGVGGIIGNRADDRFCKVMNIVVNRLRQGGTPINHDLQKAVRRSYLQATLVVCDACLKEFGVSPSLWRRILLYPSEEIHQLDIVRRALKKELNCLPSAEYAPPSNEAEQQVALLFQPKGVTAEQRVEELCGQLKKNVLAELRTWQGKLPDRFVEMIEHGWEELKPDGSKVRLDWFDLMCAFFAHDLKKNEEVQRIFTDTLLAQIAIEGTPLTVEMLSAKWEEWGKTMIARLEQLDVLLTQLRKEQVEGFSALQERLDTLLPTLTLLPDVAAQQQAMHALLQNILLELRRRPLYERYAAWEVAGKVNQLVREYQSAFFVGREEEFARLDGLLTEKSCGVLTVTAKAGFGKTALLANWVMARHGNGCFVAYHFFSHRYDVTRSVANAYRNLLRQLFIYYELADEPLPNDENRMRETLYGILREHGARDDEPLFIVLDALDESERPFSPPFPHLSDGVFVIVSARADEGEEPEYLSGWTHDAERLHLTRLPHTAMADWLRRAGDGELTAFAEDEKIVTQVDETTEGFPLYLSFLTGEMIQAAKERQDVRAVLERSPRGFSSYVREQLRLLAQVEEVKHSREVQELFALLSVALGALSEDDVQELTGLTVLELQALPWQVTRWFTIQTQLPSTPLYSFAHPLLAQEFQLALGRQAQDARGKLLDYCAHWQEHQSPYALRHYASHLREAKRWDELFALARDEAFQQTQARALPEAPDLPLRTVQTALQGAAETDDAGAMAEFLLTHARTLIAITQESPLDALRAGHLERAWELADLYEVERCVLWHLLLAWELKDTGRLDEARATLERLREKELPRLSDWQGKYAAYLLTHVLEVSEDTFITLHQQFLDDESRPALCKYLAASGHFAAALETAQEVEVWLKRPAALRAIAVAQAEASEFNSALETAQGIAERWHQSEALAGIAKAQAEAGEFETALKTAQRIEGELHRADIAAEALAAIALVQAKAGKTDAAQVTFADALNTAQRIVEREWLPVKVLVNITVAQAQAGDAGGARATIAFAIETAQWIEAEANRVLALQDIALAQAWVREYEAAVRTVESIEDEADRAESLLSIVKAQVGIGDVTAGKSTLTATLQVIQQTIRDSNNQRFVDSYVGGQVPVLCYIAVAWIQAGNSEEAKTTLDAALRLAEQISDEEMQAEALADIIAAQADVGEYAAALKTMQRIANEEKQAETLQAIATAQAESGEREAARATFAAALEKVQEMREQGQLSVGLASMAAALAQAGQTEAASATFSAALEIARGIRNTQERSPALASIAASLAEAGEFATAVNALQGIGETKWSVKALADIARAQAKSGAIEAAQATFDDALKVANLIPENRKWALALLDIAKVQAESGEFEASLTTAENIRKDTLYTDIATLALGAIALAQAQAGYQEEARATFASAYQTAQEIKNDAQREEMLEVLNIARVVRAEDFGDVGDAVKSALGIAIDSGERAVWKAEAILTDRNKRLPEVAAALAEVGDKENFKRMLIPCAYYLDAAYRMYGLLARVYPEQASAVAEVVKRYANV